MFTLLGLYDWATETNSAEADKLFKDGIETLDKILPYYDLGTFSAYDLSYITHSRLPYLQPRAPHIAPRYHAIHIAQLRALSSVTEDKFLVTALRSGRVMQENPVARSCCSQSGAAKTLINASGRNPEAFNGATMEYPNPI